MRQNDVSQRVQLSYDRCWILGTALCTPPLSLGKELKSPFPVHFPIVMLFSPTFPAQLDSQTGLISVVSWPSFAAMPVLVYLPKHQRSTRGSALGQGKKPATFQGFWGVPTCQQPPKVPFQHLGIPTCPYSPGTACTGGR